MTEGGFARSRQWWTPSKASEHLVLAWTSEHGKDPRRLTFPDMKDAKAARIGLKGFTGQGRDRLDLSGERFGSEPNHIIEASVSLSGRKAVEVALCATDKSKTFREFACHADSPST
jgi:hypothetical protein